MCLLFRCIEPHSWRRNFDKARDKVDDEDSLTGRKLLPNFVVSLVVNIVERSISTFDYDYDDDRRIERFPFSHRDSKS